MYQWQIDLQNSLKQFQEEADRDQDAAYEDFLAILGLDHTEVLWDAFVSAWSAGEACGQAREYSYPS